MKLLTPEMPCQELVELVTDYLEGALSRRDRRRFRAHISGCDHCAEYLEQMRELIEIGGRLSEEALDPDARGHLLEAFRGWKSERTV